jgi:hypothetical protein
LLVGLTGKDDRKRAYIALYDSEDPHFLHGMKEIGHGAVSALEVDRLGRVWALLPWSAAIVRIEAR